MNWDEAVAYCSSLASGMAGLTDGSVAGSWRLPSKEELQGLGTDPPATWDCPAGEQSCYTPYPWTMPEAPFIDVYVYADWSATELAVDPGFAYGVSMLSGGLSYYNKSNYYLLVWPVRSGN